MLTPVTITKTFVPLAPVTWSPLPHHSVPTSCCLHPPPPKTDSPPWGNALSTPTPGSPGVIYMSSAPWGGCLVWRYTCHSHCHSRPGSVLLHRSPKPSLLPAQPCQPAPQVCLGLLGSRLLELRESHSCSAKRGNSTYSMPDIRCPGSWPSPTHFFRVSSRNSLSARASCRRLLILARKPSRLPASWGSSCRSFLHSCQSSFCLGKGDSQTRGMRWAPEVG